ncbi:MAG: hypothetical protein ACLFRX_04555 [Gemmatimonadota bacterium]
MTTQATRPSTLRFLRAFLRPGGARVVREESRYERGGVSLPASLYRPAPAPVAAGLPGWTALHGLTHTGREHPSLDRFARALAASGAAVLVPDLPEWRALRVAPETTVETIKAAVLTLDEHPLTAPGRIGVIGFSFGATQALVASTEPVLRGHLAGVAAWGGYADIRRVARFQFLGRHELDGREYRDRPDPYGRWILAGNYLPLLPEHAGGALGDAVLGLARDAGRRGILAWSPAMDATKAAAREPLSPDEREVFDLIAPPTSATLSPTERARLDRLVQRMADAVVVHEPRLEARPYLRQVPVPVFLAHGRGDRLMPWTELVRLERALPGHRVVESAITSLFGHSFGEKRWPTPRLAIEAARFVGLIRAMLSLV